MKEMTSKEIYQASAKIVLQTLANSHRGYKVQIAKDAKVSLPTVYNYLHYGKVDLNKESVRGSLIRVLLAANISPSYIFGEKNSRELTAQEKEMRRNIVLGSRIKEMADYHNISISKIAKSSGVSVHRINMAYKERLKKRIEKEEVISIAKAINSDLNPDWLTGYSDVKYLSNLYKEEKIIDPFDVLAGLRAKVNKGIVNFKEISKALGISLTSARHLIGSRDMPSEYTLKRMIKVYA